MLPTATTVVPAGGELQVSRLPRAGTAGASLAGLAPLPGSALRLASRMPPPATAGTSLLSSADRLRPRQGTEALRTARRVPLSEAADLLAPLPLAALLCFPGVLPLPGALTTPQGESTGSLSEV